MKKFIKSKWLKFIVPTMMATAIVLPTSLVLTNNNVSSSTNNETMINLNKSSALSTTTISNNLRLDLNDSKYDAFDRSSVNVKPWKELVGTKGLLNIKESNDAGTTLSYLYTPIDAQGNIGTLVEGEFDFSNLGSQYTKAYYSGGIYSESLEAYVTTISLFDDSMQKWVVFLATINENGTDVAINKTSNVKTASLDGQEAMMAYESSTPFEFNVVPYFKTSTYSGSSDEYFLIYKYADVNYRTTGYDGATSSFFKYDGTIVDGYSTDIFRTTVAITTKGEINWDIKFMNQFKNQAEYDKENSGWGTSGSTPMNANCSKIMSLRPVLYNNETNPVLPMILTAFQNQNKEIGKTYISLYNADGTKSYSQQKILQAIKYDSTGEPTSTIEGLNNNLKENAFYNTIPRYIDVFSTTGSSSDYSTGFSLSYLFKSTFGSNYNNVKLFNDVIGIKDKTNNTIENFEIIDPKYFTYELNNEKRYGGDCDIDVQSMSYDYANKRIIFTTNYMYLKNVKSIANEDNNLVFAIDYNYMMDYNLADLANATNPETAKLYTDFNKLVDTNKASISAFYADSKLYTGGTEATREYPSIFSVKGNIFMNQLTANNENLCSLQTFVNQKMVTVDDSNFGDLKPTMTVEEVTVEQIKSALINASSVFVFEHIPTNIFEDNTTEITTWKDSIEIEKLETGYQEGVLSFKIKVTNALNNQFVNINSTNLPNQEGSANEFIINIDGFKQTPETKLIPTTITATDYEEQLPSEVPTEDLKTIIEAQYSSLQDLFGDTVPPSVDSWEVVEPQVNNDAGTITVGIQINSYYDATGKLINEPKTFPLTIDGFLKHHQPTQFPEESTNLECANPSDLTNQEIIDMVKGSISNLGDSDNNISIITISPNTGPYEDGQEITVTITGYYDENGKWNPGSKKLTYIIKKKDAPTTTNNDDIYWWIPLVSTLGGFALILILWIFIFVILKKRRNI